MTTAHSTVSLAIFTLPMLIVDYLYILGPTHNKVVVCYIGTWSVYRPGAGSFSLDNFDPSLCTHVIYAFAGLDVEKDAIKSLGK